MFTGTTIDQLILAVQRAEREAREERAKFAAQVLRYEGQLGSVLYSAQQPVMQHAALA